MKLYFFPVAPNPTRVRTYLGEKGLSVPQVRVNLTEGEQRTPEFLAKNPKGTLPVLELDDGRCVTDSLAIIEYFEECHPEPSMWGPTPEERALARALERDVDIGVLMTTGRIVHSTKSPLGLPPNPAVAEAVRPARRNALERLDRTLADRPFVAGERVSVADCTLFAGINFGLFFDLTLDPDLANVNAWFERFRQRPSANPG